MHPSFPPSSRSSGASGLDDRRDLATVSGAAGGVTAATESRPSWLASDVLGSRPAWV